MGFVVGRGVRTQCVLELGYAKRLALFPGGNLGAGHCRRQQQLMAWPLRPSENFASALSGRKKDLMEWGCYAPKKKIASGRRLLLYGPYFLRNSLILGVMTLRSVFFTELRSNGCIFKFRRPELRSNSCIRIFVFELGSSRWILILAAAIRRSSRWI